LVFIRQLWLDIMVVLEELGPSGGKGVLVRLADILLRRIYLVLVGDSSDPPLPVNQAAVEGVRELYVGIVGVLDLDWYLGELLKIWLLPLLLLLLLLRVLLLRVVLEVVRIVLG